MRNFLMFVAAVVMSGSFAGAVHADSVSDCRNWSSRSEKIALAACNQVIKKEPRAKWAYMSRARIHERSGSSDGRDRAIADYTKVIEIDVSDVEAYTARASAHESKRDYDRAIHDRTRLVEINPNKLFPCVELEFAYQARPGGRLIWEEDPRTAATCNVERPKPVQAAPVEKAPEPQAAREIDWGSHILYVSTQFAQLFLLSAAFGFGIGYLRKRELRAAVPIAIACGGATLLAFTILQIEFITGAELGAFHRFRESTIIEPLNGILEGLGVQHPYLSPFWSGPLAGLTASELVAFFPMVGLLMAIWSARSMNFGQTGGPSVFSPSDPHRPLAIALPVTILLGLTIAVAGFVLAPRDFMGRADSAVISAAAVFGALLAVSVPFMIWRRTAPSFHFIISAVVFAAIGFACFTVQPLLAFGSFIAAYFCFREWRRISRVQRAGLGRFAVGAFSWPFTPQSVMAGRAARLDSEALVAAFHLPDHTLRAKAIASAELSTRGLPQQGDPGWLPAPNRATLPPAIRRSIEPERYRRYMRNRKRLQQVVRWTSIVGIVSVVGLLVLIPIAQLINLVGGILGRKRTARVLLLRPFGQARMTSALKRVVRRHLGLLGHTYTLSDQNYRPNFILEILNRVFDWIMYVLGPLLRPSLRVTSVKDERTFLILSDFLLRTVSPSCLGLLCSDQAFNVRTTDAWWKRCIDLLMRSSDLIVMDISRVSTGSAWEVVELAKRGLLAKCVFIAQAGQSEDGLASIRQLLPPDAQPRVYMFDSEGKFAESTEFDRLLQDRIFTAVARWGDRRQEPAIAAEPVAIGASI